jgi:nucleoside-diphosphate-sugar epimerase
VNDAILITGAFGQVGKRCTEILLSRGRTVIAMDLRTEAIVILAKEIAETGHPGSLRVVHADLLDAAAIDEIVAKHRPGAIIHLAAMYSPPSYRNPALARKVNVEGTANVVRAARALSHPPLVAFASSAAVYGSRNPHRHAELITPETPVNPIDQYGQDKALAENVITDSGLPHAILRLGGVLSPDGVGNINSDYLLLMRASPGDNRLHCVDARDVGMAFANAVDHRETVNGKVLLIAGNNSYMHTHRDVEDDMMEAIGIGRLGPRASLPGDPEDDRGWSFTGWFDTTQSQSLLDYQHHDWPQTVAWVAQSQTPAARRVLRLLGPILRPVIRSLLIAQRRRERRGRYADPWTLIAKKYGSEILAADNATEAP